MAFGGGLGNEEETSMSEINVTPMVDVMLVLLVIFILAAPILTHRVTLDLPQATSQPDRIAPGTVTIAVSREGAILWECEQLTPVQLDMRLASLAAQPDPPEIRIRGDRQAEYGHVAKVMSAAQRSGIKKLGFVTKPD
jgi:biopolymer transport protein ExbD